MPLPLLAALSSSGEVLQSTTDPVSQAIVAVVIVSVFALLAREMAHRVLVIMGAGALLWAITYLTPYRLIGFENAKDALDLNVLLLLAAMMATVGVLKTTGVFEWAVPRLLQRAGGRPTLIQRSASWFTGVLSAFADNVTDSSKKIDRHTVQRPRRRRRWTAGRPFYLLDFKPRLA